MVHGFLHTILFNEVEILHSSPKACAQVQFGIRNVEYRQVVLIYVCIDFTLASADSGSGHRLERT